jgi:hypothetical protein
MKKTRQFENCICDRAGGIGFLVIPESFAAPKRKSLSILRNGVFLVGVNANSGFGGGCHCQWKADVCGVSGSVQRRLCHIPSFWCTGGGREPIDGNARWPARMVELSD